MRVLVTGGGGFLGRYIVKLLLERGYQVRVFGRRGHPDLETMGVDVFRGDIEDAVAVNNAIFDRDAVFHVAAKAGVWGNWKSYYGPNVVGTENVLRACKTHGVQYLVHTSTPSVVFNGKALCGVDETMPYGRNWLCHYAHTKAIAEERVLKANDGEGVCTVALRPHLIWGIGDPNLIPRIVERGKKGKLRIVGDGENLVDIIHVKNAAHGHLLALDALKEGRACGKAYFLSQGEPVKLWPWIDGLLKEMGIEPVEKKVSMRKAYVLGGALEVLYKVLRIKKEPMMTRFVATELAKDHYFSIKNAQRDLGYKPLVSTEEGVRELVEHDK